MTISFLAGGGGIDSVAFSLLSMRIRVVDDSEDCAKESGTNGTSVSTYAPVPCDDQNGRGWKIGVGTGHFFLSLMTSHLLSKREEAGDTGRSVVRRD